MNLTEWRTKLEEVKKENALRKILQNLLDKYQMFCMKRASSGS